MLGARLSGACGIVVENSGMLVTIVGQRRGGWVGWRDGWRGTRNGLLHWRGQTAVCSGHWTRAARLWRTGGWRWQLATVRVCRSSKTSWRFRGDRLNLNKQKQCYLREQLQRCQCHQPRTNKLQPQNGAIFTSLPELFVSPTATCFLLFLDDGDAWPPKERYIISGSARNHLNFNAFCLTAKGGGEDLCWLEDRDLVKNDNVVGAFNSSLSLDLVITSSISCRVNLSAGSPLSSCWPQSTRGGGWTSLRISLKQLLGSGRVFLSSRGSAALKMGKRSDEWWYYFCQHHIPLGKCVISQSLCVWLMYDVFQVVWELPVWLRLLLYCRNGDRLLG